MGALEKFKLFWFFVKDLCGWKNQMCLNVWWRSGVSYNEQGFAQGFALCKIQVVRSPEGLRAGAKPCSLYGKPEGISVQHPNIRKFCEGANFLINFTYMLCIQCFLRIFCFAFRIDMVRIYCALFFNLHKMRNLKYH